jgi:plasmid stabilization system protein ParE
VTFTLHPGAERDLGEAARFYRREAGRGVAGQFLDEFECVAALLVANPGLGIPTGGDRRWFPLHGFPYSIIYRLVDTISGSWSFGINTATQSTVVTAADPSQGQYRATQICWLKLMLDTWLASTLTHHAASTACSNHFLLSGRRAITAAGSLVSSARSGSRTVPRKRPSGPTLKPSLESACRGQTHQSLVG